MPTEVIARGYRVFKAQFRNRKEPKTCQRVAVFVRSKKDDPAQPDAFYLGLLRGDTLALVVEEKDWSPAEPCQIGLNSVDRSWKMSCFAPPHLRQATGSVSRFPE